MTLNRELEGRDAPLLQVELAESPHGYLARFRGDLVAETTGVLWGIEPILLNETRVSLDLSGVTSVDQAGLKAGELLCVVGAQDLQLADIRRIDLIELREPL